MKKQALALIVALALAPVAGEAGATDFYLAGLTDDSVIAVDLTRELVDGDTHTTWVTFIFHDVRAVAGKSYTNSLMRFSVNCRDQTHRMGVTIFYKGEQEVFRDAGVTDWSDILPESRAELISNVVCSNKDRDPEFLVSGSAGYLLESVEAYFAKNR